MSAIRRSWFSLRPANSPMAQAMKHIALRGRGALETTAMDDELAMYRAGTLPMDYRPPRDTPWDDTVERWAYAWQYPVQEGTGESVNRAMSRDPAVDLLEAFAERLLDAPPAALPSSADASENWPVVDTSQAPLPQLDTEGHPAIGSSSTAPSQHGTPSLAAGTHASKTDLVDHDAAAPDEDINEMAHELFGDATHSASASPSSDLAATQQPAAAVAKQIVPAEEYIKKSGLDIPIAYVDDRSERAQASKELGLVLTQDLGLPYDPDGVADSISALSHRGNMRAARAVFDFALQVGFTATPDLFGALMHGYARKSDFDAVMNLIEDMKERGVTPARRNWTHLMAALINSGQSSGALQVADNMRALANIEPDERVFAEHLRALALDASRLSSPYEAVTVFDQMEHSYGMIPMRIHYEYLLLALSRSTDPELVQKMDDVARRMELLGFPWTARTYATLLRAAAMHGDLERVEHLSGKMREEGLAMAASHYASAIIAQGISMSKLDYHSMKERVESPLPIWLDRLSTAHGILGIVDAASTRSGEPVATSVLDSVLRCEATVLALALEHLPDDAESAAAIAKMEQEATALWESGYDRRGVEKTSGSYAAYLHVLAAMQRIDEAEGVFEEMVEEKDWTPPRHAYVAMIHMHLASGEEGSTSRALEFMEAMQALGHRMSKTLMRSMVDEAEKASYKRDMRRRARRIMEAREEYRARKEAEAMASAAVQEEGGAAAQPGVGSSLSVFSSAVAPEDASWKQKNDTLSASAGALVASRNGGIDAVVAPESTYSWWDRWRRESISKHELFDDERPDGLPRGESFAEKNAALAKMGITSPFNTPADVPGRVKATLVRELRKDGSEPAGALWSLDGDTSAYPTGRTGPDSWGVQFWRERQVIKGALADAKEGRGSLPPLTTAGNTVRTVSEQLAIEKSGAKTPGALRDAMDHPDHAYDDGKAKPASEFAAPVPVGSALVWQAERQDPLTPYRDDVGVEDSGDVVGDELRAEAAAKTQAAIDAIRSRSEAVTEVIGGTALRKPKYDYLERYRELYRQGGLEAPDEPLMRFGRSDEDTKAAMAAQVQAWFDANNESPLATDETSSAKAAEQSHRDSVVARKNVRQSRGRSRSKRRGGRQGRDEPHPSSPDGADY